MSENIASKQETDWNEGLDLSRGIAVLLVVYSHGKLLLSKSYLWAIFNDYSGLSSFFKPGWWGVRIFFALSGYLIGRQAILILANGGLRGSYAFAFRRWIRTVPTYWLFLSFFTVINGLSVFSTTAVANALFIQTLMPLTGVTSILEVSWSLVIEEWSYALISLILVILSLLRLDISLRKSALILAGLAATAVAGSIVIRINAAYASWIAWDVLKKTALFQLDSLSAGIAMACIELLKPKLFTSFARSRKATGVLALAGMSVLGYWLNSRFGNGAAPSTADWLMLAIFGYPVSSLLSCSFLLCLWQFRFKSVHDSFKKSMKFLSKTSYSLYLVHLPLAVAIERNAPGLNPLFAFVLYFTASILLAYGCWFILEKPFLLLRRYFRMSNTAHVTNP